ncbi:hypothetical protein KAT45_01095 [Candidatus Aerophobetes bacterium]|nr:hypothetical protein [Candidatus Aerophobetes bacterium]
MNPDKKSIEKELLNLKRIGNRWERRLFFAAIISEFLQKNYQVDLVVVGGNAVEFYTLGSYSTEDIDVVVCDFGIVEDLLRDLGFEKINRIWYREDLDISIDLTGSELAGDPKRVSRVSIKGKMVQVIGLEDIIVDRLNAFIHWKSEQDGFWAQEMVAIHQEDIDWKYLEERCKKEQVASALEKLKKEIKPKNEKI